MYDHHRDFCRRNFVDPQQVWEVSWCWDAVLPCRPCLVHACHLFELKCSRVPMELVGLFMCLIFSMCSVSCWSGTLLGSGTSHVPAFHWTSLLYRRVNRIFVWQMPCRIFGTLLGTKLVVIIPCWTMCTWCHQAHCNPWARAMLFSTKQVLAKQFAGLSRSFLNRVKHVPFPFPTGQAYNVWKCCTFSET